MDSGLYIHVPFCSRKCPYCDFYSISSLDLIPLWLDSLVLEVTRQLDYWPEKFDTVYLGGGSPSLLTLSDLNKLKKILEPLKLASGAEVTLEANPEDVTEEKAKIWADWGINRVSLGLQSFDDRWLLDSLGRSHLATEGLRAMEAIVKTRLRLSLDLIFAHAGQTQEDWAADLDKAANSGAEHISAYVLTSAPGTPLARALQEGTVARLPGEGQTSELFLLTNEALKMRGFQRYEISNFAQNGAVCQHNMKYWRRGAYLGLGPSAHSFDGVKRWANVASVKRWAASLARGDNPFDFQELLTPEQVRLEQIMLGFRLTEGVPADLIKKSASLDGFINDGYLIFLEGRLIPTEKGFLIADALARTLS